MLSRADETRVAPGKSQIPSSKEIPIAKFQKSTRQPFGFLGIEDCLGFGAWDLGFFVDESSVMLSRAPIFAPNHQL
jgi:hypothetical protein